MTSCPRSVSTEKSREARRLAVNMPAGDTVAVGSAMGPPPDDAGSDDDGDHPGQGDGSPDTGQMECSRAAKRAKKDDNARTCGLASPTCSMGIAGWEGMIPDDALTLSQQAGTGPRVLRRRYGDRG